MFDNSEAVPCLPRLIVDLSLSRATLSPTPVHMRFAADGLALRQVVSVTAAVLQYSVNAVRS